MNALTLNAHLIGRQGGRATLNTPALVVDVEALGRNIAAMAALKAAGYKVAATYAGNDAAAEKFNADLIVIGRGVVNRFAGDLRTEAYGIMRESPCPVISV